MRAASGIAGVLALGSLACGASPVATVIISAPVDGKRVSGMVQLEAEPRPLTGIKQVEFVVEALSVGVATAPPFSVSWDSSAFAGRTVAVTARVLMNAGGAALSPPIHLTIDSHEAPLALGPESMYSLLNEGSIKVANELLQNIWDLGSRSTPMYLDPQAPSTWDVDPFDRYSSLLFYSLRPTANLLWAYYTTGDPTYRDKLLEILRSFAAYDRDRPYGNVEKFDRNYTSAFRAMVLTNTFVKLKRSGDLPADIEEGLRCSIYRLGVQLGGRTGVPGYYGNHGFTAAAALVLLAKNFPEMNDGTGIPGSCLPWTVPNNDLTWNDLGASRLYQLATATAVDPDGVEIENSPFYHLYVMTFVQQIMAWTQLWDAGLFSTFPNSEFPLAGDRMADFAAYILQPDGRVPLLGSSVTTGLANQDPAFLAAVSAEDPAFAYVASQGAAGAEPKLRVRLFPSSGMSVLRSGFGPPSEFQQQTFLTFNVGSWRNDHNHLDVLGITYYSAGRSLLPDSGLFVYKPEPEDGTPEDTPDGTPTLTDEHNYFFGTSAHNTVVVDGQDQTQLQLVDPGLTASGPAWAYQSGRDGVNPGVLHERAVLLLQRDLALVVDWVGPPELGPPPYFPKPGLPSIPHDYVQTWHFAPDLVVTSAGPSGLDADAIDSFGVPQLSMVQGITPNVSVSSISGSIAPIQGWYSEKYGVKVPNTVLEYKQTGNSPVWFATLLASGPFAGTQPQLKVDQNDAAVVRVRVCAGAVQYQVEIDNLSNGTAAGVPAEAVQVTPITTGCN